MPWLLIFAARAARELDRSADRDAFAIRLAIERMARDPGAADIKKLGARDDEWRLRVGRWRVIFTLDAAAGLITVQRVLPCDRAYRN